jgi:hypothetical protein
MSREFALEDWMDLDWLHIVMHFPNTKELREPACNPRLLKPSLADDDAIRQAEAHGYAAGNHLMLQYLMHQATWNQWGIGDPSNRMIIHITRSYAKQFAKKYRGRRRPVTGQKIFDYKKQFRPVAHLWAALRLYEELTGNPYGYFLQTPDSRIQFLGSAAAIQDFGLTHIQDNWKGPGETLLDADNIWRVPDSVQRLKPRLPAKPPDSLLKAIETYKAS